MAYAEKTKKQNKYGERKEGSLQFSFSVI